MDDRESSGTASWREGIHRIWIEDAGIGTCAGPQRSNHFAGVRIHDDHLLVVARGEEAPILPVHGYARGSFAGRERPAMEYLQRFGIDLGNLILVGNVDEHAALTVGHHEFGLPVQLYRTGDRALGGVDGRRTASGAVHDEDALGHGFVG